MKKHCGDEAKQSREGSLPPVLQKSPNPSLIHPRSHPPPQATRTPHCGLNKDCRAGNQAQAIPVPQQNMEKPQREEMSVGQVRRIGGMLFLCACLLLLYGNKG